MENSPEDAPFLSTSGKEGVKGGWLAVEWETEREREELSRRS